jgi:formate-dependent nitrite reductase cytochrome c552 subunit
MQGRGRSVAICCTGAIALTFEKFHCHERIEEVRNTARMQSKFVSDLCACEAGLSEHAEKIERNRSQQDLGIPKAERGLHNCIWCWRIVFTMVDIANVSRVTSGE